MCIFASSVSRVSRTRILVSPTKDGRQLTIYQNSVASTPGIKTNAMILPCPSYGGKVQLVDLSRDTFNFERLDGCFPHFTAHPTRSMAKSIFSSTNGDLEVHALGAYNVSIAPSIADLSRANRSVFTLAPNVQSLLERKYSTGYAFVICAFDPSKDIKPHPVAYVHDRHRNGNTLFVPCVHEHGHGTQEEEHFDHDIYSLCCMGSKVSEDARVSGETPPQALLRLLKRIEQGKIHFPTTNVTNVLGNSVALFPLVPAGEITLRRGIMEGMYPNVDLLLDLESTEQSMKTRELDRAYMSNAKEIQKEHDDMVAKAAEKAIREYRARREAEADQVASFSYRRK